MTPNVADFVDSKTRRKLDACVTRTVASLANENTLAAETPSVRLQRVLKVYAGIKPLLVFLTTFPLLPQTWRAGLVLLNQVLESLASIGSQVTVQFKAGKDLDPAA